MKALKAISDPQVRNSLKFSVLEVSMWGAMYGFAENFVTPLALFYGASAFQIALLQGMAQFSTSLGQLAGGSITQHGATRKAVAVPMVVAHSLSWAVLFVATWITASPWAVIVFYCLGLISTNMGGPAWASWMNDLVPSHQRGLFWSGRNQVAGIVQFASILIAGLFLEQARKNGWALPAFAVLMGLGLIFRGMGGIFLSKQHEPPMHKTEAGKSMTFFGFLKDLTTQNFGRFVLFSVLLNFSIVMVNPIIQVHLLKVLNVDYFVYSIVTMTVTVSTFIFMTYWGPLTDRYGNRRVLVVTSLVTPFLSLAWVFVHSWELLIVVQLVSGFALGGLALATSNFIFDAISPDKISKAVAYFNTLNTFFAFLGALAGGFIFDFMKQNPIKVPFLDASSAVFATSTVLRIVILLLLGKAFTEVRKAENSPGLVYFYIYKPAQDAISFLVSVNRRLSDRVKTLVVPKKGANEELKQEKPPTDNKDL